MGAIPGFHGADATCRILGTVSQTDGVLEFKILGPTIKAQGIRRDHRDVLFRSTWHNSIILHQCLSLQFTMSYCPTEESNSSQKEQNFATCCEGTLALELHMLL